MDYSALLTQLETSIAQNTFEDTHVTAQIVADLYFIRQNFANLFNDDANWFLGLETKYVEAAVKHLRGVYLRFTREKVDVAKTYFYIEYTTLFHEVFLVLHDTELSSCVILLEKMQQSLRLTLEYKLEEYNKTVHKMLEEIRAPGFTPSIQFALRIKQLNTSPESDTQNQMLMTSENLGVRIKGIKKLLWEDLQRTYEQCTAIFELQQFEETIDHMLVAIKKPGFTPSDKFAKQIQNLKNGLDRERPKKDNMIGQDFYSKILIRKRNLCTMLDKMYREGPDSFNLPESKKIAAGRGSKINAPGVTGAASPPHTTQVQTHATPSAILYPLSSSLHKPCTNCEYCNFYPELVPMLPDLPCEL